MYTGKAGLQELFKEHYATADLRIEDIQRREIAFLINPKEGVWDRAKYYENISQLTRDLVEKRTPPALFASTAYYMDPNERRPTQRGIMGWDFIIDIDSYIEDSENRVDFIDEIREKTKAIIERFLPDLGFDVSKVQLNFSGNKGFHIRLSAPEYRMLSKDDRQQIMGYIVGDKLDRTLLLENDRLTFYGWDRQVMHFINKIAGNTNEEELLKYFPKSRVKKINSLLSDPAVIARLKKGSLIDFDVKTLKSAMIKEHKLNVKEIVDKGCTTDRHRILRVPGSIHPSTGLPAISIDKYQLENPDLIVDEIMRVAGEDIVEIELQHGVSIDFPCKKNFTKGVHNVPRYEALCALVQDCKFE